MSKSLRLPLDPVLLISVLLLLVFSVIMVGSASLEVAEVRFGSAWHILVRWIIYMPIGLLVMWLISLVNPSWWEVLVMPLLVICFVVLVALLVLGNQVNGATRWFSVFGMTLQPIELIKPVFVMYVAFYLSNFPERLSSFVNGLMPMLIMLIFMVVLLLLQPDFGNVALLIVMSFCLWFVGGVPARQLLAMMLLIIPVIVTIIYSSPYRMKRVTAFMDPWADRYGSGYQLVQSEIAFGVGGLTGVGIGQSVQKLFYLPESFTDFITAVIGEELGLVGILMLIAVFTMLCWRGFKIAMAAEKTFSKLLVVGCTLLLAEAFIINLGAATGVFPTKGMPMPFVSYGGSALIGSCMLVGLIFSVQRHQGGNVKSSKGKRGKLAKQSASVAAKV